MKQRCVRCGTPNRWALCKRCEKTAPIFELVRLAGQAQEYNKSVALNEENRKAAAKAIRRKPKRT